MEEYPSKIVRSYSEVSTGNKLLSRYKSLKRLVNEDGRTYIETPRRIKIKETSSDRLYTVPPGFENRIDLVSYKFYKTPYLWWAIASVNNIENPMILEPGVVLRIPNMNNIIF